MSYQAICRILRRQRPALVNAVLSAALLLLPMNSMAGRPPLQQTGSYVPTAVNRKPDANDRDKMQQQKSDEARIEAANAERKKQISSDSDKLLKMAADLKTELDNTSKDTLSIGTIHKIDAIEKLAHDMKNKMKLRSN
jgi:hypothetical protein